MGYSWAANYVKEARAIKELVDAKKEVTEEAVKELYLKYGGLVIDEPLEAEEEVVTEAPRRGRSSSK